jgi:hypothetical protein
MSSKVVEADAGIHSLAIAVAVRHRILKICKLADLGCSSLSPAGDCTVSAMVYYPMRMSE